MLNFRIDTQPVVVSLDSNVDDLDDCLSGILKLRSGVIISSSIFITLTALVLVFEIFLTIIVCRLVWANDKIIPLMLVSLCASLLSLIFYYSFITAYVTNPEWSCADTKSVECLINVSIYLPSFFLANATLLNLNKWIYYTMRIFAFIKVGFGVKE